VVAADVYSSPDKGGRGGWTWYTGSAGWLYRAAVESILGIQKEGDRLTIRPVLPHHWNGYSATLKLSGATYRISVQRGKKGGKASVKADGVQCEDQAVALVQKGNVDVQVTLPS
jgi:cyclic beta-1,2-glucan synthetase